MQNTARQIVNCKIYFRGSFILMIILKVPKFDHDLTIILLWLPLFIIIRHTNTSFDRANNQNLFIYIIAIVPLLSAVCNTSVFADIKLLMKNYFQNFILIQSKQLNWIQLIRNNWLFSSSAIWFKQKLNFLEMYIRF